MLVLALDTATETSIVALVRDGEVVTEHVSASERAAARHVLVDVAAVLAEWGGPCALDGIVVGVGPGSFTGLRIGIATAVALGDGAGVPVAGVSTLAALRHGAPDGAVAVIDARRGEVFAEGPGVVAGAYAPATLAARITGAVAVGDGALRYADALCDAGAKVPGPDDRVHRVSGRSLARLAVFDRCPVVPQYLREPDAVPPGAAA